MKIHIHSPQVKTGHLAGVKKNQTNLIVHEVAKALVARSRDYIKWPAPDEMRALADINNEAFGLPNMPLGVDGSLIRLAAKPSIEECPPHTLPNNFISRKRFPAINIQVVGDSHHLIRDCNVQWVGSTHDGRVWRNSRAKKLIERQAVYAIAADSAYPIARTVVKPYGATPTESHVNFNFAQARLRNDCTEKIFGQVKSRFRILHTGLRTSIERSQLLIVSCLVLHNMALMFHDSEFEALEDGDDDGVDDLGPEEPNPGEAESPSEAQIRSAGEKYRESLRKFFE